MNDLHDIPQSGGTPGPAPDRRRRRFLGAGASITPAVLTLASQPALGITCFTPSRSLSRNTSLSQTGQFGECTNAESPGNYSQQFIPGGNGKGKGQGSYHWPIDPGTPFHPTFARTARFSFDVPSGNTTRSLTMLEVLNLPYGTLSDSQQVAFHIVAAYLNKLGGNGAMIPDNVMTVQALQQIWLEWGTNGRYEVMAGIYWGADEIKGYLISNGIVKPGN